MEMPVDELDQRAAKIRLLCTDIDGVLTSGALHYDKEPGHTKAFHVRDGAAIKWLQRSGIPVAFISGLTSDATLNRPGTWRGGLLPRSPGQGPGLGPALRASNGLVASRLPIWATTFRTCPAPPRGAGLLPADAVAEVKAACHWVSPIGEDRAFWPSGQRILKSQAHWNTILALYEV